MDLLKNVPTALQTVIVYHIVKRAISKPILVSSRKIAPLSTTVLSTLLLGM